MPIVLVVLVGLVAGALAGRVVSGDGYGVLGDIVVGVVGALVGGWVFAVVFGVGSVRAGHRRHRLAVVVLALAIPVAAGSVRAEPPSAEDLAGAEGFAITRCTRLWPNAP